MKMLRICKNGNIGKNFIFIHLTDDLDRNTAN